MTGLLVFFGPLIIMICILGLLIISMISIIRIVAGLSHEAALDQWEKYARFLQHVSDSLFACLLSAA